MKAKIVFAAGLSVMFLIGLTIAQQASASAKKVATDTTSQDVTPPPPPRLGPPNPLMVALDADKDGKLSATEISGAAAALAKLDTNADGELSADELRPARPEPPKDGQAPKPGDHIMRLDADSNGFVTFEEFTAPMKDVFSKIDTSKDNQIDKDEAAAAPPPPPPHGFGRGGPGPRGEPGSASGCGRGGQGRRGPDGPPPADAE